ncbi:MAG: transcription-repair coupling factor [Armatimonadota bacterium]
MPPLHVKDWVRSLNPPDSLSGSHLWAECCEESRAPLLASLLLSLDPGERRALILTPTVERAVQWHAKLALFGLPESSLHVLTSVQTSLYDDMPPERQALSDRTAALAALASGSGVVIAVPQAALEICPLRERFASATLRLEQGDGLGSRLPPNTALPASDAIEALLHALTRIGYEHEDPVRRPGAFSRRGGILDVFPFGAALPVRIEFFGDEVDSMRAFDVETQRSTATLNAVAIRPGRLIEVESGARAAEEVRRRVAELPAADRDRLHESVEEDLGLLEAGLHFDRLELYLPALQEKCTILDYAQDALLVVDDPMEVEVFAERAVEDLRAALTSRLHRAEVPPFAAEEYLGSLEGARRIRWRIAMSASDSPPEWFGASRSVAVGTHSLASYRGRSEALSEAIVNWGEQGTLVVAATDQPTRAKQVLSNLDLAVRESLDRSAEPSVRLLTGNPAGGFVWPGGETALLTDLELFGAGRLRLPQRRFREGVPISSILDLKPGDYVVHIQYGIGVYRGLTRRTVEGVEKEFLQISYKHPDHLLLPADQLDRVQKYLSPGDKPPTIHRITGGGWSRAMRTAREGAAELARELVELYARRTQATRPPYGPDSPWQSEMEAAFPYTETPSQFRAIKDLKQDLNEPTPMDRLVCGDVGFGKTEVAVRAAFKAVQAGRQVAVLCPTTILADQHYETFRERLAPYPVRIGLLSRFRTVAQRRAVVEGLLDGSIDIVIGTHALLQRGVRFANLGMVIVDEEQRFGVRQKEALKKLRANADFLTLTATPIPRTLNMALMHIRDMSLIDDPPPGRLPVRTYLRPYSEEAVREALLRELARGGQAFYVFNRVQGIQHVAEKVRRMVPNARVAVAHGQMSAEELEPVMMAFYRGEVDVLVCTTIIENGIDNPNVNTLVVDGADRLGMAQLYQLRGRVGRSDRQAYCYLTYRKGKRLTDTALGRLKALEEFTALGSGYALAFRDLQIRGAGELLGAKQHGLMHAVGYELYMELIHDAVVQLKTAYEEGGMAAARLTDLAEDRLEAERLPPFDLPVEAYIPNSYVVDDSHRLAIYRRMSLCRDEEHVADIEAELRDRFGPLPRPTVSALRVMRMRIVASRLGISRVEGRLGRHIAWFRADRPLPASVVAAVQRDHRGIRQMRDRLEWPYGREPLESLERFLSDLAERLEREAAPVR